MNDIEHKLFIAESMMGGVSNAIERQEARGQSDICRAKRVPLRVSSKDAWESLGLVFGEPVDDLFQEVTLPEGWDIQPTDHSMHNKLVDGQGRTRGGFFYKAAFYDRDAFMGSPTRFYTIDRDSWDAPEQHSVVLDANGESLYTSKGFKRGDYRASDAAENECRDWLTANRPEWEDPLAYWSE